MKKEHAFIVSIIGLALLVIFGHLFNSGILHFNYPDKKIFPIRGIDISHHQKMIDWNMLKNEDITFAYIKATEGGDFKDSLFSKNWTEADQAGIIRGAYHFFTFCKSGAEQAKNFMDTVPIIKNTLPPAIDLEFGGNCKSKPVKTIFMKELNDYINKIRSHYNKNPVIYVTYEFYEAYFLGHSDQYNIWIRNIFFYPKLKDKQEWIFWQYSNRGRLNGIEGFVDLNVFKGEKNQFDRLLN